MIVATFARPNQRPLFDPRAPRPDREPDGTFIINGQVASRYWLPGTGK